jgi:hypothetical protein
MLGMTENNDKEINVLGSDEEERLMGWEAQPKDRCQGPGYLRAVLRSIIGFLFIASYLLLLHSYVQTAHKPMGTGPCVNGLEGKTLEVLFLFFLS